MQKFRYDTYCGIYCGTCDTLLANERGKIDKLAKAWKRSPEDLRCHGCKSESLAIFCIKCSIRICALKKKVDFCYQCDQYPCKFIVAFRHDKFPHHSVVIKNQRFIQQIGVQKWLIEQKVRWSCPKCNTVFSWYDRICKNCKRKLYNCQDEEKELNKIMTAHLLVHPITRRHLKFLLGLWNYPGIMHFADFVKNWNHDQIREWYEKYMKRSTKYGGTERHFIIKLKDGKMIGESGVGRLKPGWSCPNYRIMKSRTALMTDVKLAKAYWHKGYGTEAMQSITRYVFTETNADILLVPPHRDNVQAIRVYEKAGFRKTDGMWFRCHMIYEMTKMDFKKI